MIHHLRPAKLSSRHATTISIAGCPMPQSRTTLPPLIIASRPLLIAESAPPLRNRVPTGLEPNTRDRSLFVPWGAWGCQKHIWHISPMDHPAGRRERCPILKGGGNLAMARRDGWTPESVYAQPTAVGNATTSCSAHTTTSPKLSSALLFYHNRGNCQHGCCVSRYIPQS